MPMPEQALIAKRLADFVFPFLDQTLEALTAVQALEVQATQITLTLRLPIPVANLVSRVQAALCEHLGELLAGRDLQLTLQSQIEAHSVQAGLQTISEIKNIIAIASGKGGVGKSTTAVNLALALQAEGAAVGLLDADIYGPSQPALLGVSEKPDSIDGKQFEPLWRFGVASMSIGYLIEEQAAMIWRGPMVSSALQQLLRDTRWPALDYLIIDLPPGTGDIQLTLAQKVPVTGAVVVTTPQDLALLDVRRAIAMFEKVQIPILGVVENMAMHTCEACGHQEAIFGEQGAARLAKECDVPILGQLPLASSIRAQADSGVPIMVAEKDGTLAVMYRHIAWQAAAAVSRQKRNRSHRFPKIVVEST